MQVPNFVTHYYLSDRRPFLNLSDLDADERTAVMDELNGLRRAGQGRRRFGPVYATWRQQTEGALHDGFLRVGGKPVRLSPHYFVLGESPWFRRLAPDMASCSLPLTALPAEVTSFTLVDSFAAMGHGAGHGYPIATEPHEQQVHRLDQLDSTLAKYGMRSDPVQEADLDPDSLVGPFVEVQLWDDGPVAAWLR